MTQLFRTDAVRHLGRRRREGLADARPRSARLPGDGAGKSGQRGLTYLEMIAAVTILLLVSMVALPIGVNAVKRGKELRLRRALVGMRHAIDEYHKYAQNGAIQPWDPDWEMYPKDFDMLVEGVEVTAPNNPTPKLVRFLRETPVDPVTGDAAWGTRSYQDDPDSSSTGNENLYDVYSLSPGTALDGTPYSGW